MFLVSRGLWEPEMYFDIWISRLRGWKHDSNLSKQNANVFNGRLSIWSSESNVFTQAPLAATPAQYGCFMLFLFLGGGGTLIANVLCIRAVALPPWETREARHTLGLWFDCKFWWNIWLRFRWDNFPIHRSILPGSGDFSPLITLDTARNWEEIRPHSDYKTHHQAKLTLKKHTSRVRMSEKYVQSPSQFSIFSHIISLQSWRLYWLENARFPIL